MGWNRSSLFTAVAVAVLFVGRAEAQTCAQMIDAMKAQVDAGHSVYVSFSTSQANKITTSTQDVRVVWNSTEQQMDSFPYPGNQGPMRFNDRDNTTYSNQNFSAQSSHEEYVDLTIKMVSGVAQAHVHNLTWGNYLDVWSLTCGGGMMYGFGSPIGNWQTQLAMYVFTYRVVQ